MKALAGLRVLDLSMYLPGPYASMLLADFGADVIHIESPSGDPARRVEPVADGESALHAWVGRNKRSLVLDLKTVGGLEKFLELVEDCDVILEGFTPGVADRLGVGYSACRAVNPNLVYCSLSGTGYGHDEQSAPGHDMNYLARAGFLAQATDTAGIPVPIGPPVADISAGVHAAFGVLAALRHRDTGGGGQFVDVSLLGAALAVTAPQLVKAFHPHPLDPKADHNLGADPAYRVYQTQDSKFVAIGAYEEKYWGRLCGLLGRPDLVAARVKNPSATIGALARIFATQTQAYWNALLDRADVCYSPVNEISEVLTDSLLEKRGDFVHAGTRTQLRNPIRMSKTPAEAFQSAPAAVIHGATQWHVSEAT